METNIWVELAKLAVAFLGGGGLWAWIKAREDKRKVSAYLWLGVLTILL